MFQGFAKVEQLDRIRRWGENRLLRKKKRYLLLEPRLAIDLWVITNINIAAAADVRAYAGLWNSPIKKRNL